MMGNEGHGLTEAQKAMCDGFVYIPQFGKGTASLNVSVAAAIVMHRFASWAGYEEQVRDAAVDKFSVEALPDPKTRPRTEKELELRAARARARADRTAAAEEAAKRAKAEPAASTVPEGENEAVEDGSSGDG